MINVRSVMQTVKQTKRQKSIKVQIKTGIRNIKNKKPWQIVIASTAVLRLQAFNH